MSKIPDMPDEFTVDELVASWLEAQLLGRAVRIKQLTSKPPNTKAIQEATRLMVECKLIGTLMEQAREGIVSRGARAVGLDSIPVSDKGKDEKPVKVTKKQVEKAINLMNDVLGEATGEQLDLQEALESLGATGQLKLVDEDEPEAKKSVGEDVTLTNDILGGVKPPKKEKKPPEAKENVEETKKDEKDTNLPDFQWSFTN